MIKNIPIPTAGVMLGLTALGNLLQVYGLPGELRWLCGTIAALLGLLLVLKLMLYPQMIKNDFTGNSILASVSATFFMAVMQLASYTAAFAPVISKAVWFTAIAAHFALMGWFTYYYIIRFKLCDVFPTYFITYVGIVAASTTAPLFNEAALGESIFWFGFIAYIIIFALVTYRYLNLQTALPTKPLFCIYTAPMSLSLAGYLSVAEDKSLIMLFIMQIIAQVLFLAVLARMPRLLRLPFFPSYAAFTFPFVITALAFRQFLNYLTSISIAYPEFLNTLALLEAGIAALIVSYVLAHYVKFLLQPLFTQLDLQSSAVLKNK